MAAPPIPPIRLGLTGTGLAIEKPTGVDAEQAAACSEIPVPPAPDDKRLYGTEGVLAGSSSERRVTCVADAVRYAVRPVGGAAQSVATAMVVQRALDSAERAADLALDPVPGAGPVPLWRLRGSTGLPGQRISSSASFVA